MNLSMVKMIVRLLTTCSWQGAITTHPMPRAPQKQTRKRDSQREGMSDSDRRQPSTTPIDICPLRTTFNINLTSITNVDCHNTTFGAITGMGSQLIYPCPLSELLQQLRREATEVKEVQGSVTAE